jgi:parallel beta-helix repeat protein
MSRIRLGAIALAACFALAPAGAAAVDYPPPTKPNAKATAPKGPFKTYRVCKPKTKSPKGCLKTIQSAVNKANPGDTIRVPNGTYKEQVNVRGRGKKFIKLIGNPKAPSKVVLEGSKKLANGVFVNGADGVTVNGFTALNYKANGFFVTNVNGYTLTNLRALLTGVYGIYAFNSIGGTMSNSVGAWTNDAGFYVGQTPVQTKPVRTTLRNVTAYGNVIGYSGTNARYTTITDSRFYNNGAGIVPNALDSEKWPPAEDNVITRNEVFWNNFNYYKGAPWPPRTTAVKGSIPFPVGVGILLFGGRDTKVTGNKVFGNWLGGVALVQALTLKNAADGTLKNNEVSGNVFGAGGQDLNGIDIAYTGDGTGNCFGNNTGANRNLPADPSFFPACAPGIVNTAAPEALKTLLDATVNPDKEAAWVRGPHISVPGVTPLETYTNQAKGAK